MTEATDRRVQLVVLGQDQDPHVRAVLQHVDPDRFRACVVNIYAMPDVVCSLANGARGPQVLLDKHAIDCHAPTVIWNRPKPNFDATWTPPVQHDVGMEHWRQQWRALVTGLTSAFSNAIQINCVDAVGKFNNKLNQLMVANSVGLTIPDTVFGNDRAEIVSRLGPNVLFKPLTHHPYRADELAFAGRLDLGRDDIDDEEVRVCPGIFQRYVEKSYELRVIVFGDAVWEVRIDSQKYSVCREDWRMGHGLDIFVPQRQPKVDRGLIRAYMARTGLRYGVFDFIVDKEGGVVFLECNPDGQWLGYAKAVGLELGSAFAGFIDDTANEVRHAEYA